MGVRCDLHAVDHDLHVEVRTHQATSRNGLDRSFLVVELCVGDGWVTLFLSRDQAEELAARIDLGVSPLYGDYELPAAQSAGEEAS